ncbi:MAG: TIGR03905 family TSCPD domain-containing protein [Firmicutes bacterium]|jgi:uncharacterized protein (TIGR03905 family)|nr:TIGR03905 family TSCPD domain-containing protein [Bacillota bacterium]
MEYKYTPSKVCSRQIELEMEGDVIKNVTFVGGCHGNLQGLSALVRGMTYDQVKERLSGIRCGFKDTSCPDQLVKAIEAAMASAEEKQ